MPFLSHLQELRNRLARTAVAIVLASILCFSVVGFLFKLLSTPLLQTFPDNSLIGTGPADAFIVKLKIALASGFLLSLPYSFLEVWKFISPGLLDKEKKYALPFVFFSSFFFICGVSFCFVFVLPIAFEFFAAEFTSIGVQPTIRIGEYLSFVLKLLLVFGLVFEMPVVSFFLARLGILKASFLIEKANYAIVIIFIVAAIVTPPDVVTQTLLAIPLMILYGLCIFIAKTFGKSPATSSPSLSVAAQNELQMQQNR